ncbi:hypothetical protein SRB17_05980 [Streptomyces sp. RB17]|uniref:hypothetical protein n=1 Tax=Streptomyces sp. RB17 TaxID=2585197 RepID=UPI001294A0D6|nr:hypothetical protein [Streptomyces sp. RB17]MQY32644.1 hypothetical protein [Streptomyces sp. RB17]
MSLREIEARGYEGVVGRCMDSSGHMSARTIACVVELTDAAMRVACTATTS